MKIHYQVLTTRTFKDQEELDEFLGTLEANAVYPELCMKMLRKLNGTTIESSSKHGVVRSEITITRES